MRTFWGLSLLVVSTLCRIAAAQAEPEYRVGAGIYDITGPVADVMMMGYVDLKQTTAGIHTRLRSRAFVIEHALSAKRVVLVTIDQLSVADAITTQVLEKLRERYGSLYTASNTLISATHTHSAPGAYSHYVLYDVFSSKGFSEQNFNAIVEGTFQSIVQAHNNLVPAYLSVGLGELEDAGVSRSPDAYLLNPLSERKRYPSNVDKTMTLLKFTGVDGTPIGLINWFAVHNTSMKKTNRLISSDNKGYASLLFERELGNRFSKSGKFVAAFANSNAGDVSPSSGGADVDENGDWVCALRDNFKCTALIAGKQYRKAKELFESPSFTLSGEIDYRHKFVDMSQVKVTADSPGNFTHEEQRTCFAAIGLSMLAGTKDGWGVGREKQTCSDPSLLGGALCTVRHCHGEKPVVLATGLKHPFPWTPPILPVQVIRIGPLALAAVPGEFTTMSGRRVRETVHQILEKSGVKWVVLAGYANSYAGYVATREEYQMQNYEGASTHFGEWTLAAYQQELASLANDMVQGVESAPGPLPLDTRQMWEPRTPLVQGPDKAPVGKEFGDLITDALPRYRKTDSVQVQFWSANPNNDLFTESSYLEVQRSNGGRWETVAVDGDFETTFSWDQRLTGKSIATIEWTIPADQAAGHYRILHRGRGDKGLFENVTRTFLVQ